MPEALAQLLKQQLHARPTERPFSAAEVAGRLRAIGNILVSDYTEASAEDDQAPAASEPPIPIPDLAANQLPATDVVIQQTTLPTVDLHARTPELETNDAQVATYADLNLLQEESEKNTDEITVTVPVPAELAGQAKRSLPLTSRILSALSFGARSRSGAMQPKATNVGRRARLIYAAYATAIILGLAGGLWLGNRDTSLSPPTTSQATPAAEAAGQIEPATFAKTSSEVGAEEPFAGDVNATPADVENPSPAATPVAGDEHAARRTPPDDEAPSPKELETTPSAVSVKPHGSKAAIGSYVSAGREPEQRQVGGPCRLLVSERALSIRAGGGSDTITVSSQNVHGPARVTATTKNWPDIVVFPESRGDSGGPVRYSVTSVSKRSGTFAVNFNSPCGVKTVRVTVQQP
jgi:hypothetical protein